MFSLSIPKTVDLSLMLRGFFASAVVFWHVRGYQIENPVWDFVNVPGRLSVWMFFGLSGYALVTKKDFSFLSGFLTVGFFVLLAGMIASYLRGIIDFFQIG